MDAQEAYQQWRQLRVANIHQHVTAADVLTRNGVTLARNGAQAEQISCPFHGTDRRPSAKYFPEEGESPSHVWCFVCREKWDAIGLWKRFTGTEKFTDVLRELERQFGLTCPEPPHSSIQERKRVDPVVAEVQGLLDLCERRLKEHRERFEMRSHLKLGQILDHTRFYVEQGTIDYATAKQRLQAVLNRIGEIARAKAPADP